MEQGDNPRFQFQSAFLFCDWNHHEAEFRAQRCTDFLFYFRLPPLANAWGSRSSRGFARQI
jgi:hypothetical protein